MAQIINNQPTTGAVAGSALGQALQGLAGNFVNEFARGKARTAFEKQYPEHADVLAQFHGNPAAQQKLIQHIDQQRASQLQQLLKQQADKEQADRIADYLEEQGLDRELAYGPKEIRTHALQKSAQPLTWAGLVGKFAGGEAPGKKGGTITQVPVGQIPGKNQVSAEQAEILRSQGYDVPLANEATSIAQRLSSLGVGYGTGAAGLYGDILSGAGGLLNAGASALGLPTTEEESAGLRKKLAERIGIEEHPLYKEIEATHGKRPKAPIPPTSEELKKGLGKLAKGTAAEKYVTPQTSTQKWYEDMGQITNYLSNPSKVFAKSGALAALKDLAKGASAAAIGHTAGWMTEEITGSKFLGEALKNGIWLGYNLFPGSLKGVAQKEYSLYEDQVIKAAEKQGKTIDMRPYQKDMYKLQKEIGKYPGGSETYNYLAGEVIPFQDIMKRAEQDPKAFWEFTKELGKNYSKAPAQAKRVMGDMLELADKILDNFGKRISPDGAKHLKQADSLWKQGVQAGELADNIRTSTAGQIGLGMGLMFQGWYRKIIGLGAGIAGLNYLKKVLVDPTMQKYMTEMAKASSLNNTALMKKTADKINKRAMDIDPKTARELMKQLA